MKLFTESEGSNKDNNCDDAKEVHNKYGGEENVGRLWEVHHKEVCVEKDGAAAKEDSEGREQGWE